MKKFILNNIKYLLLFLFFLVIYQVVAFSNTYGDPLNSYGFSHAIRRGEIPYLDFNTITTPLYAYVMAVGLFLFDNYLMFNIEQALLCTVMFYFIYKMYSKKAYLVLLASLIFLFFGINPTYNFLTLFFLVIILYLEKFHSDKDYLIGFMIGLSILSKHTIGVFFLIPSFIFYFKDKKRLLKRMIPVGGVLAIFTLYLAINKALEPFIDLCFLGLFDFSSKNGNLFTGWFGASLFFFIIILGFTIYDKKDISRWYLLFGISFMIPISDMCHFALYFVTVIMFFVKYIKDYKYLAYFSALIIILYTFLMGLSTQLMYKPVFTKKLNHFQYTLTTRGAYLKAIESKEILDKYEKKIVLSTFTMQYDIISDNKISYYDVLLYGNFGYDGINKMIDKIKDEKDVYILVDLESYNRKGKYVQFAKEIVDFVTSNYEFIKKEGDFLIYYKE